MRRHRPHVWAAPHLVLRPADADPDPARRYDTPTGDPCPRTIRYDGSIEGTGRCVGCGTCLLGSGLL